MDRFMRSHGFDLFGLTVRRYSHTALPAPYTTGLLGPTVFGRPVQGDALYLRDPCAAELGLYLGPEKLLALAAIASLAQLPDFAAEILLRHRTSLENLIDLEKGLDLLAAQAQACSSAPLGHHEYIAAFERGDPMFLHGGSVGAASGAYNSDLYQRLLAMEASTSWRITKPLRWLKRKFSGK